VKVTKEWLDSHKWFLRTSDNGVSYGNYKRKRIGAWNDAGDEWTGIPTCDECGGFFGIDEDAHDFGLLHCRSTLELCEWRGKRVVIGRKICVSSYRVIAVNADIPAEAFEACGYNVAVDGQKIESEHWIAINVSVWQSGGYCYMHGKAVSIQTGGLCYMHGNTTNRQSNGYCYMYGNSTNHQSGGCCYLLDNAINNQSGGHCERREKDE